VLCAAGVTVRDSEPREHCSGGMQVMVTITEPTTVKKILTHLGLPTEPLPRAQARDPTGQESFDFDAA
jgi:hypothetical protein